MTTQKELLSRLYRDRPLAHKILFAHRRTDLKGSPIASPPFHKEMIDDWHGPSPGVIDLVFRGAAKSTLAEEAITLMAGFREFRNCLVIGENYDRAASRLHAIKREIDTNERLEKVFGKQRGIYWADDRIILANGICIQALGKGQSLRGIKHEDQRPDLVFGDDLENREDVKSPEARKKTIDWFTLDVMPAMDPQGRKRVAATPLHPESLACTLEKDPDWIPHKYPIYYLDEDGQKVSSWPERFPIKQILKLEAGYAARGQVQGFRQEYLCESEAPETKAFKREHFVTEPRIRTWEAVYSMTDPARTVNRNSADTGRVVWSWIGPKLVIWDAVGSQWMPDEIVSDLFEVYERFGPVWMGVEEDGLNQFLMQPIRQAMVARATVLPVRAMKAPNGKLDFIRGLQPFFSAKEVIFTNDLPDLKAQLLGFPNGKIDVPNALAYALRMKPGAPIYEDFSGRHIGEALRPIPGRPVWLCLNATGSCITGVLVQVHDTNLRIYADYLREGDPGSGVSDVISLANLDAGQRVKVTMGPMHFDQYKNVGLRQAVAKIPLEVRQGVGPERARGYIRAALQRERQGVPMLMVSSEAKWTLRAFAGGYARATLKNGVLADVAEDGPYKTLVEGLESFLGLLELGYSTDENDDDRFNATTHDGRSYRSMLGNR